MGVAAVFGGSLFLSMHRCLATSSLLAETAGDLLLNADYNLGQISKTYSIPATHSYFGKLIFQDASFNSSRSLNFFLGVWPLTLIA